MRRALRLKNITFPDGYALFVFFVLLIQGFFWISPSHAQKITAIYLWPAGIAALALYSFQYRKKMPVGMPAMLLMTVWAFLTCVLNKDYYLTYNLGYMVGVVLSCGVCYPVLCGMERERRLKWLKAIACGMVAMLSIYAWLGVYTAISGNNIPSPFSGEPLGMYTADYRLYLFGQHPNGSACCFAIAIVLALYLLATLRHTMPKVLCVLAILGLYIGIALTDSRTVMFAMSIGAGMFTLLVVLRRCRVQNKALRLAVLTAVPLLVAALLFVGYKPVAGAMLSLQRGDDVTSNMISVANAEEFVDDGSASEEAVSAAQTAENPEAENAAPRTFSGDISTFRGRTDIWLAGLNVLKRQPVTLLIGMLDSEVSRIPVKELGRADTYHMHNMLLEVLMLTGIPGLLICLYFIIRLVISSIRLFFAAGEPLYTRMLPIIPAMFLLNGMLEAYPFLGGRLVDMLFFVFSGAVMICAKELKPKAKL